MTTEARACIEQAKTLTVATLRQSTRTIRELGDRIRGSATRENLADLEEFARRLAFAADCIENGIPR